jgi:CubicO group peptidase (beta-lactamase class C family)
MTHYPHKKLVFLAVGSVVFACTSVTQDDVVVEIDSDIDSLVYDLIPKEGGASATLRERMDYYGVPGISVAVLRNGEVGWARGFGAKLVGTEDLVDTATVFSVASLSKVAAAATTLRLVNAGLLDLDRDVMDYLTSWSIPENPYTTESPVTLRRLMSHTAGTTVHGFADFQPGEALPTTVQILEGSGPAKNSPVVVSHEPGTIQQLVIEDVTGSPLANAAVEWVFDPLGLSRSSFVNPLPAGHGNIARAHDDRGRPTALPRGWEAMPEAAASGLWTSPSDYSRLVIALRNSWLGTNGSFINHDLGQDVMTKVGPGNYGLGPYLGGGGRSRYFSHGGSNESYKSYFRVFLESGDGAVIFTNGAGGSDLVEEIIDALDRIEGWPG